MSEADVRVIKASLRQLINMARKDYTHEATIEAATILKLVEANAQTRR